jgi:putative peptidoglycan lipid II flippase
MLQSRVLAYYLGVGFAADAFFVAWRIPNLLRRFTAEGTMTAAFLPTMNEVEASQGPEAGRDLVARFLGTFGTLLLLLCLVALPAMGLLMGLQMLGHLAPGAQGWDQMRVLGDILLGRRAAPDAFSLTTLLARIMFPYLVLVSLTAGLSAVLNLKGRFGLTTLVFTFWNLTFIAFAWACIRFGPASWRAPERAVLVMAAATMAGGVVQCAMLWPSFRKLGYRVKPGLHLGHPGVRSALRRMGPGLLGTGIHPINVLISMALASQLATGAQTVLFNANMMGEMILGICATSVATVSLPAMSRLVEAGDLPGLRRSLSEALRGTAVLVIPGAVGMAVLAGPIIALIFQTGRFGPRDVAWTASTLGFQAVGLLFIAAGRILAQCCYALKDYRRPAYGALMGMGVNVVLSYLLMRPLGTGGIALANGLSSIVGLAYMARGLSGRHPGLPVREVGSGWLAMAFASAVMGLGAWAGARALGLDAFHGVARSAARLLPLMAACALAYGGLLLLLRVPEGWALLNQVRRRLVRHKVS